MKSAVSNTLNGHLKDLRRFASRESGAVSAEYALACAIVVGFGTAASVTVGVGTQEAGRNVSGALDSTPVNSASIPVTPDDRPEGTGGSGDVAREGPFTPDPGGSDRPRAGHDGPPGPPDTPGRRGTLGHPVAGDPSTVFDLPDDPDEDHAEDDDAEDYADDDVPPGIERRAEVGADTSGRAARSWPGERRDD